MTLLEKLEEKYGKWNPEETTFSEMRTDAMWGEGKSIDIVLYLPCPEHENVDREFYECNVYDISVWLQKDAEACAEFVWGLLCNLKQWLKELDSQSSVWVQLLDGSITFWVHGEFEEVESKEEVYALIKEDEDCEN